MCVSPTGLRAALWGQGGSAVMTFDYTASADLFIAERSRRSRHRSGIGDLP